MNSITSIPKTVHLIGATGRSGAVLMQILQNHGCKVVALIRNPQKWQQINSNQPYRLIDLKQPETLKNALSDATHIINTGHARYIPDILKHSPANASFVFLGSTRKFTRWPDHHGNGVLMGEKAFLNSHRQGVILHPTMIYGSQGENNVQRLAKLLKKLPIIPLPNAGKSLVQPIHQSDVTKAIIASLSRQWDGAYSIVIAGKQTITYREFIEIIMKTAGIQKKPMISVSVQLLKILAFMTIFIPKVPTIKSAEIQRLIENKDFDISMMKKELGFTPIDFISGIKQTKFN